MPPSAGACQTTEASLNPDCGRAGERSSIITAIGWSFAAAGLTRTPSSGAATRTGVGSGVGLGEASGLADPAPGLLDPWPTAIAVGENNPDGAATALKRVPPTSTPAPTARTTTTAM